jgi:hypothetical protein
VSSPYQLIYHTGDAYTVTTIQSLGRRVDGTEISVGTTRSNLTGVEAHAAFACRDGLLIAHTVGHDYEVAELARLALLEQTEPSRWPVGWAHGLARLVDPDLH